MADTSTISLMLELARQDESPLRSEWSRVAIADETLTGMFVQALTTGVTVDLSSFATIDALLVRNRSQAMGQDVRLEYGYKEFSQRFDSDTIGFSPGGSTDFISNVDPQTVLTDFSNSDYRVGARIQITNTDAAQPSNITVDSTPGGTSPQLDFNTNVGFINDPSDARNPVLTQLHDISVPIPPTKMHIANNVHPADNLLITSLSGTPKVDLWVLGT